MISVCIATFNGELYIKDQLDSILIQIGKNDEIIISDDNSSDRTINIVLNYNDDRIKVFQNPSKGLINNFENALRQSSGDLIFLADQDDIWSPDKVIKMSVALNSNDLAVCDCSIINDDGKVLEKSYFNLVNSGSGVFKNLRKNTYLGCCIAFKRNLLKKALPFPPDIPMHDIWLGFVGDLFYKTVFIKEQLTFYRKHANNASITSNIVSNFKLLTKVEFRVNTVKYLPTLILR